MKRKFLVLGLVTAFLCMAAACNSGGRADSGSMANKDTQKESSSQSSSIAGSDKQLADNSGSQKDANGITGTGGANGTDNVSLIDDAGDFINNMIDDASDGISNLTDNILGKDSAESGSASSKSGSAAASRRH